MLVLSRDCQTVIRIGPDITVKVLSIRKRRVKLGVDAPSNVRVWRGEISPQPGQEAQYRELEENAQIAGGRFSVLVVEDDPEHARLITEFFSECGLGDVTHVWTGRAAIEVLGGNDGWGKNAMPPDLVLLDLCLPDISGLEVLRWIRSRRRFQTMPVLVLSGNPQDGTVADCLEAGANAFVGKPVDYGEFRESLSRIATFWRSDCRIPRPAERLPV